MDFGSIAAWVAVVPSAVSAGVAIHNARKSASAARDAEEALALTLRPEFSAYMPSEQSSETRAHFTPRARHDALDLRVDVHTAGGVKVGSLEPIPRVQGTLPGGWQDPTFSVPITGLTPLVDPGDREGFVITLRFHDERKMHKWEQRIEVERVLVKPSGGGLMVTHSFIGEPPRSISPGRNQRDG